MILVPRVITSVPLDTLPEYLDSAHHELKGFGLPTDAYAIAVAQLKLEHGIRSDDLGGVWCFNFGNIDATPEDKESVPCFVTVAEHEDSERGPYTAKHIRRAYPDEIAGLVGYWEALTGRYVDAYLRLVNGDVDGFADRLRARGYYTAPERQYDLALRRLLLLQA